MILEDLIKYGPRSVATVAGVAVANAKTSKNECVAGEALSLESKNKEKMKIYNNNSKLSFLDGVSKNSFNGVATATVATFATDGVLPDACPLVDGGHCPPGCRFETRLMIRMLETGTMPDPLVGCPLRGVCGLFSVWPRQERSPSPLRCLGHECAHISRAPETNALRCEMADAEVIDLPTCPDGRWSRKELLVGRQKEPKAATLPGECETCPACDKTTMMCHFTACYQHRAGRGVPCTQIRANCPRKEIR